MREHPDPFRVVRLLITLYGLFAAVSVIGVLAALRDVQSLAWLVYAMPVAPAMLLTALLRTPSHASRARYWAIAWQCAFVICGLLAVVRTAVSGQPSYDEAYLLPAAFGVLSLVAVLTVSLSIPRQRTGSRARRLETTAIQIAAVGAITGVISLASGLLILVVGGAAVTFAAASQALIVLSVLLVEKRIPRATVDRSRE